MPTKTKLTANFAKPIVVKRLERIYDPIPPYHVLNDKDKYAKYAQLAAQFATRQLEIERAAIDVELEMVNKMTELFTRGIK